MFRSIMTATALAAIISITPVLVPAASLILPAIAQEKPMAERPYPVIRVSGEGQAAIAPDMAILTLGILREGATAREALDLHKKASGDVIAAMKEMRIEPRDLQTAGFSIQPRYFYPNPKANGEQDPPKIVGYAVSSQLVVRIRDIAATGTVLDKSVTLGVNSDGSIEFTNDNPAEAIAKARGEAMKDAMSKAKTLADAAGVKLGAVLEISESSSRPQPLPITRGKMMAASADSAVPVEAGENAYNVNVQAVFEIMQ
jgi:hypothetical protein